MATRTVSLSEDAYHRLKRLKLERESFSDVVLRLSGREDLMRYAGSISSTFADEMDRHSGGFRKRFDQDARRRLP